MSAKPLNFLQLGLWLFILAYLTPYRASADLIYVCDEQQMSVSRIDMDGTVHTFAKSVGLPYGIAVDNNNTVYVAATGPGCVRKITPDGVMSDLSCSGLLDVFALAVHNGLVYCSIFGPMSILIITPGGVVSVFYVNASSSPLGLAFDNNGNLYVSDTNGGQINKFSPAGEQIYADAIKGVDHPWGLAFDSKGNLYAANNRANTVTKMTPDGSKSLFASGLYYPTGLAFDSSDNLYVCNGWLGTVSKITPDGTVSPFAKGFTFLTGIAILKQNQPPIAKCKDVTVSAGSECTASASVDDGSYDPDPGDTITLSQSPAGPYPLGITTITLTVTDSHGASNSCNATVTVVDDTPPDITCPADIVTNAISPEGVEVSFEPTASDNCAVASLTSTPASGSLFPIGDTTVTCTAVDTSSNQAACSFTVHVKGAEEQIRDLIVLVQGLCLPRWQAISLIVELDVAAGALRRGDDWAACDSLDAFLDEVSEQRCRLLRIAHADSLIADATRIRAVLGCHQHPRWPPRHIDEPPGRGWRGPRGF